MFAPFLPFVTEEVWSWWREGSIHRARWPEATDLLGGVEDARGLAALEFAAVVLGAIRKKKSEEQRPLKTPVARTIIRAPEAQLQLLPLIESDVRASGMIRELESDTADALDVFVELAPPETLQEQGA